MPSKSRRHSYKKQSRNSRSQLAAKKEKTAVKLEKRQARKRAVEDRQYKRKLKALYSTGLYSPKSRKLTKARKAEINRKFKEFEEFLTNDAYIYVPIPTRSKKKRRKALKLAKQNQLSVTQKGVFVPKTKTTKSAVAVYSKKTGTYRIKIKKRKVGPTGAKTTTEILPIEPMGSMEDELERIHDDAAMLELQDDEALAYRVTLNEEGGYSWRIFDKPDLLANWLDSGVSSGNRGTIANRLQVYRSVSVFKTKREKYFDVHPRPDRNPYLARVDKTGRSITNSKNKGPPRSGEFFTPWEQGYAAYNSGFALTDNPWPRPPQKRQWRNGWLQAKEDDGK